MSTQDTEIHIKLIPTLERILVWINAISYAKHQCLIRCMFLNVLISSPSTANTLWIESNEIIVRLTVNGHLFTYPAVFSIPYVDFLLAINTVG